MLTVVSHNSGTVAINVHFHFEHAIEKRISVSAYNTSIYLHTESYSSECERRRSPNKKKIREFLIHAANLVRIAIDAGNFDALLLHFCIASLNVKVIAYSLHILLERAEKRVDKNCIRQ